MGEFIALHYSPWSEKARWSLDFHGMEYDFTEYMPMLGAFALRLKTGKWSGPVTVPVFRAGKLVLSDSFDIASYAAAHAAGIRLITDANLNDVRKWNTLSERALFAGRIRTTRLVLRDSTALAESLPNMIPKPMRKASVPVAVTGANYLMKKYGDERSEADCIQEMREVMLQLREGLGSKKYLLADFSYADVAMAVSLQFLKPVADPYIKLGANSRRYWTCPELVEEFADLVAWRDNTYDEKRRAKGYINA